MKTFAILSALATFVAQAAALTVNTPGSIVQCQPVLLSWTDGTAPYFLTVIPGGQPSAAPLKSFPQTSDTSLTWLVDLPAGTSVTIALRDSTGQQVFAQALNIQTSSNASCINTAVDEGGSTAAPGGSPAPAASGATTTPATTPAAGTTSGATTTPATTGGSKTSAGGTTSGTHTSTSSTGTASGNAAGRSVPVNAYGIAGVLGLVGAALL